MGQVDGLVVVVTGGASGIGRATSLRFAQQGARAVLIGDINMTGAEETAAQITALGVETRTIRTDVSNPVEAAQLIQATIDAFGRIDVLVNNAAILISKPAGETTPEEWNRVVGVNLTGVYLCSYFALPHMLAQGHGSIINLASPHAFQAGKSIAAYAAAKGGVVSLTRQMAVDYGRLGLRVNCVVPGAIDTPMLRSDIQQGADVATNLQGWSRNQPIGRLGYPEDIAKVIVWLASADADFILGAPIIADGGLLAQLLP